MEYLPFFLPLILAAVFACLYVSECRKRVRLARMYNMILARLKTIMVKLNYTEMKVSELMRHMPDPPDKPPPDKPPPGEDDEQGNE